MMGEALLKEVRCKWCGEIFHVCRSCWRVQVYCGERCRKLCRMQLHREAQRRYRQTAKGKQTHREYEQRRRIKRNEKTMADRGTTAGSGFDIEPRKWSGNGPICHFCGLPGVVVAQFPHRVYGGKVVSEGNRL